MQPEELFDYAMGVANRCHYWADAWHALETGNWVLLGCGANGAVFEVPGSQWVVKVFDMNDGYFAFATYAKANPCPIFPTIKGIGSNRHNTIGVCVLEKLDETVWDRTYKGSRELPGSPWRELAWSVSEVWRHGKIKEQAAQYVYWPQLLAMAQFFGDAVGYDLHGANWMMRGDQLVMTDPFCGVYGTTVQALAKSVALSHPFRKDMDEQIEMDLGPFVPAPDRGVRQAAPLNDDAARLARLIELVRWQPPVQIKANPFAIDQAKLREMDRQVECELQGALAMMSVQKRQQWGQFAFEHRPDLQHNVMRGDKIAACLPPPMPLRLMSKIPDCKVETLTLSLAAWEMLAAQWDIERQNKERKGWGDRLDRAVDRFVR